ncbi:MAG: hypothetical protein ABEJ92_02235, partial [Halobacteriales archaeon]
MSDESARECCEDGPSGDGRAGSSDDAGGNAGDQGESSRRTDPFASGVGRRRLMRASAAAGVASVAGCSGLGGGGGDEGGAPTVFVFNNGDRTVSVVDAANDELVDTVFVDTTASFPANQYGTTPDADYGVLWLNVDGGVRALDAGSLDETAFVETGFG